MAVSKICDYSGVVEYGYTNVYCSTLGQTIGWNFTVDGFFCTNQSNGEAATFYLGECFQLEYIYKFEFKVQNYVQGDLVVKVNGVDVLTIDDNGTFSATLTGLSGTVELKLQPNNFNGCFIYQIFKTSTLTSDFPQLVGISINGEYTTLDTPITFDPNLTDIKDYFQSLGYTVNVLQTQFYTHIHFSQIKDVIDYIIVNPSQINDDVENKIYFEEFNCPTFPYGRWECCESNLVSQLYNSEKYKNSDLCILNKIKYLSEGIKILQKKDSNCLSDEEMKSISDKLDSLCCSPCPPDNQISKFIQNPPPTTNRCREVQPFMLRGVNEGAICSGSIVVLYMDTSVYYTGYIYLWEQSTDNGVTWVEAEGYQPNNNVGLFFTNQITQAIRYRLTLSCQFSTDLPYVSNEISYVILSNPVIVAADKNDFLPTCANLPVFQLTVTDIGIGGTYYWVGPNGFTSTQREPFVNLNTYGPGVYTVLATTSSGCQGQASFTVNDDDIIPIPVVGYDVTPDSGIGDGEIYIEILNSNNALFDWGINNAYGPSANITGLTAGTYNIQIISDEGCILDIQVDVPLI